MKTLFSQKVAARKIDDQIQFRIHLDKLQLPEQVDAIYKIDGNMLTVNIINGPHFLCKIKSKFEDVNEPFNADALSLLAKQRMARFEFVTNDDEFAIVVMNYSCFKRL